MDEIDRLITAFRSEDTASLPEPDSESQKDRIISELEDYSSEPKVLAFLLEVASDTAEYDLARIEAFKVLHVRPVGNDDERNRIGSVIAEVILNEEDDDDVRNYAAIAAAFYMAVPGVDEAVEKIVLDPQTDPNLRANGFDAIERNRTPKRIRVVQSLLQDGQFSQTARRVLRDWGVTS